MSQTPISAYFGEAVRCRRLEVGLTQEKLAERAKIHPTYVGLVERGERNPSLDIAERISEGLEMLLADLVSAAYECKRAQGKKGRK